MHFTMYLQSQQSTVENPLQPLFWNRIAGLFLCGGSLSKMWSPFTAAKNNYRSSWLFLPDTIGSSPDPYPPALAAKDSSPGGPR